ncbi:MAG: AAA family ATPase [Thermoleophilaceae bacterium]
MGERCYGFMGRDGQGAICTRMESDREAGNSGGWYHSLTAPSSNGSEPTSGELEAQYIYEDEDGVPLFEVVRFPGKKFKQRRPGASAWGIDGVRRVPYKLPFLIEAVGDGLPVYIVEGEKDVRAVERAQIAAGDVGGYAATCNPGGAGKWRDEYSEYLRDADVIVVADRDDGAGLKHAREVRRSLVGVAASVVVVEAAEGKDVSDHLDAGLGLGELVPVPPRFERVDLATHEPRPAEWLFDSVLLRRAYTLVTAQAGRGKTFLALGLVRPIIEAGEKVVYFDQENGPDVMAERTIALGVARDALSEHLHYFPYPSPQLSEMDELLAEIGLLRPALVVFDSKANFLASADLEEDSNDGATKWHALVVQPIQAMGSAVLELDHTGHKADGRPRGGSAKEGVAEASWMMSADRDFDGDSTALVTLARGLKNRRGELPPQVTLTMGGDGKGGFIFDRARSDAAVDDVQASRQRWQRAEIAARVEAHYEVHGEGLSLTAIDKTVTGTRSEVREVAKDLGNTPNSGFEIVTGPRSAVLLRPTNEASE